MFHRRHQRDPCKFVIKRQNIQQQKQDGRELYHGEHVEDKGIARFPTRSVDNARETDDDNVHGQCHDETHLVTEDRPQGTTLNGTDMPCHMIEKEDFVCDAEDEHEEGETAVSDFVHVQVDGTHHGHAPSRQQAQHQTDAVPMMQILAQERVPGRIGVLEMIVKGEIIAVATSTLKEATAITRAAFTGIDPISEAVLAIVRRSLVSLCCDGSGWCR